jgi:hypothetical protein
MSAFDLPIDEVLTDTPVFDDQAGNVTSEPAGATVTFTPGDASVGSLTVSADGKSAVVSLLAVGTSYTYSVAATKADGTTLQGYTQVVNSVAGTAVSVAPGLTASAKAA